VGGDGNGAATGADAVAEINGEQLTGVGDRFSVELAGGDFELEFAGGFEGEFAPITVRSVAATFDISGGDGAGLDVGVDGVALINGSEVNSADDRFAIEGEYGSYVIEFANGFSGGFDPITVSTPELSLVGADEEGAAYGTDAEATVNGQQLVGKGSRFSFFDNGRQVAIEFQAGFSGEFDTITVARRERLSPADDGRGRARGVGIEGSAAVDTSSVATADSAARLVDEVNRLLTLTDEHGEEVVEDLDDEVQEPVEVIGQAEIVRRQFAAVARDGYFAAAGSIGDARQASIAQLKGLVDLLA